MARKKENDYYKMFLQGVDFSCAAAKMLQQICASYNHHQLPAHLAAMHRIEHEADTLKHTMMQLLLKEFITPIDREDIMQLGNTIDDVTDSIEDVLLRLYMYNVVTIRPEVVDFTRVIVACCTALRTMLEEFPQFRKSKTIHAKITEVNRLEEDGDRLYTEATRSLYLSGRSTPEILAFTTVFDRLEKCCDRCEDVADVVEQVILKNS